MSSKHPLANLVDAVRVGRLDAAEWVSRLSPAALERLDNSVTDALRPLPIPIGPRVSGPAVDKRRILERIRALVRAQRGGDRSELVATARVAWLRGGGHLAYLRELAESGRAVDAALLGRTLLHWAEGSERAAVEEFLLRLSHPPDGWWAEVDRFAESPSVDGWTRLVRFAPRGDAGYLRRVHTLDRLLAHRVNGTLLFECIAGEIVSPEALRVIEEGDVDPVVIERHAQGPGAGDAGAWLGAGARAAVLRGDRFTVIRLLREAAPRMDDDVDFIWSRADEQLRAMMVTAGLGLRS